jgi:hypothetical protein
VVPRYAIREKKILIPMFFLEVMMFIYSLLSKSNAPVRRPRLCRRPSLWKPELSAPLERCSVNEPRFFANSRGDGQKRYRPTKLAQRFEGHRSGRDGQVNLRNSLLHALFESSMKTEISVVGAQKSFSAYYGRFNFTWWDRANPPDANSYATQTRFVRQVTRFGVPCGLLWNCNYQFGPRV